MGDRQSKFSWGATMNPMFSCSSVPHLSTLRNYKESHAGLLQHSPPEHSSKLQWISRTAAVVFLTWTLLETTINPMFSCCSDPLLKTPWNYNESHAGLLQHSPPEHSSKLQWIPCSAAVVFLTWTLLETTINPMFSCCSDPLLKSPSNYNESYAGLLQHSSPEHSSKLQWIPCLAVVAILSWRLLETTMNPMLGCCSIPHLNTPRNYNESHV